MQTFNEHEAFTLRPIRTIDHFLPGKKMTETFEIEALSLSLGTDDGF